jgi:hypothetical protein
MPIAADVICAGQEQEWAIALHFCCMDAMNWHKSASEAKIALFSVNGASRMHGKNSSWVCQRWWCFAAEILLEHARPKGSSQGLTRKGLCAE